MKVIFLCQRVPWPPDRGDRITTSHFLRHLLDRGASVRVGCFREEAADDEAVSHLSTRVQEIHAPRLSRGRAKALCLRGLLTGEPLTLPFFRSRRLGTAVARWLREDPPDLIHVYSSSMAQYVPLDPRRSGAPVRLMQFAELDSDKWAQFAARKKGPAHWVYAREARLLLEYETSVARAFEISCVVSETEKALFERRIPDVEPEVLPNGVDVDHFASAGDDTREEGALIFTGVMDYEPNVDGVRWFVASCWPEIRRRHPAAKLRIVGSRPVPPVVALAAEPGIEVTGRVPRTPPWFDRSLVAIAPLRLARGIQNKVLEAMSMGLPVVCTPQAAQGLPPGAAGIHVAVDEAAMIESVSTLLSDPAAARREGRMAAAWIRERCRWENVFARYDGLLARHGLP
ncbi:MAG: TIGR03087 family PEP-CTERM/XrtA system glycosyltransferase [Planctomycetota bacterium]